MRRFFFIFAVLALFFAARTAGAAMFDPKAQWQTIQTEHFRVHHPKNIEEIARHAAAILEEIYPEITDKWKWTPWNRTEVIFTDSTDESNGLSSVLPYNWMLIYAMPPSPDSSLAHYDDWLKMLLIHEYTHIVQLDANGGIWRPIRLLLGKTVAPSGVDPTWIREGIAQLDETYFTGGGRGRGSYSEMVVRASILEGRFPSIDLADGLSWKWPSYKTAYVYGIKFIQWLNDNYGEEKFLEFDRRVRSSLMLAMVNHQARKVYGKTFYELWNEWKRSLEKNYSDETKAIELKGLTAVETLLSNEKDEQYESPVISPDSTRLAFTAVSPHKKTEIRIRSIESGKEEVIRKGQEATQISWNADGTKIVYSAMGAYKRYYRYNDLWLYDIENGSKKLTSGSRDRDPDFFPSGEAIVFVSHDNDAERLKRMELGTKEITTLTEDVPRFTQFANPRVSPDGRYIVVSIWKPGEGWRIHRYDADGKNPIRLTSGKGLAIESRPVFAPDGRHVLFSSDETGISNIYSVSVAGGDANMVTNVLTGVFQPSVDDSDGVAVQYYTSSGFGIAKVYPNLLIPRDRHLPAGRQASASHLPRDDSKDLSEIAEPVTASEAKVNEEDLVSKKYVAFGKSLFLPRFLLPNAAYVGDTFFASLTTGGADVLRWHNWAASGTYRTDANYFGYSFQYWYNRFKPLFGATIFDYAVNFGNITFVTTDAGGNVIGTNTVHLFEHRRAAAAFFALPIQRHSVSAAYFFEDHMPLTSLTAAEQGVLNLGHFAGFRAEYRYGDAERYPAAISQENGRTIRLTGSVTNKHLGSADRNEQIVFSGDWREFVRLWGHNVMALRAAGGMTWGDRLVQGTFGLGGALGEGGYGGAGSYNYFPFRGLPVSAFSRNRAMLFTGEYRFPIIATLRGLGTIPVFLKDISGALFSDFGNAWNAHEAGCDSIDTFFDQFLLSVGAELRGNFIIGHGLPLHGRLGYAIVVLNRSRLGTLTDPILGDSIKNGMLVLTLGTSF